jgi:uncharacterized protein
MMGTAHGSLFLASDPKHRIANLDEDEATLAVEAGQRALAHAWIDPLTIRSLEVGPGTEVAAWSSHVKIALGLGNAVVGPATSGPPGPNVLRIESNAGRSDGRSADAIASIGLLTPNAKPGTPTPSPSRRRPVDANHVVRLRESEARCLAQVPMGASISRQAWEASLDARYRLLVSTCTSCKATRQPPLDPCHRCGQPTTIRAHDEGTLHTWTTIAKGGGPTEFDEWQALDGDYVVAVVDLAPGVRVAGMMVDPDPASLRIGQRVRRVFRRLYAQEGAWRYGTKFQSIETTADR